MPVAGCWGRNRPTCRRTSSPARWDPDLARAGSFRCPLFPFVPLLFIALSLYISVRALQRQPVESLWGLATLASGVLVYFLVRTRVAEP